MTTEMEIFTSYIEYWNLGSFGLKSNKRRVSIIALINLKNEYVLGFWFSDSDNAGIEEIALDKRRDSIDHYKSPSSDTSGKSRSKRTHYHRPGTDPIFLTLCR